MKRFKKICYIVLFVILLHFTSIFILLGMDCILFDNFNFLLFFNKLPSFSYSYTFLGVILLFISYNLSNFVLYIYSYKILSKLTWYKFFRDREKEQRKLNFDEWKKYNIK